MLSHSLLIVIVLFFASALCHTIQNSITDQLTVKVCPEMPMMKNVDKNKLLGVWYAYATTPLPFRSYQRRCASYNVKDSPYFDTHILYTNYNLLTITYACDYNQKKDMWNMKLRILTRTRTPMQTTIKEALGVLGKAKFPIDALEWLMSEAFCFEWYELKFETELRPKHFQAPFNREKMLRMS